MTKDEFAISINEIYNEPKNLTNIIDSSYNSTVYGLPVRYSAQLTKILRACKRLTVKIIRSTALQLLRSSWLTNDECYHCGQMKPMYDAYCCLECDLRINSNRFREQKKRAAIILAGDYSEPETIWAKNIIKLQGE